MHAKKFLAAFLALSMTAVPQTTVSVFAENEKVQENNDDASKDKSEEENTEEAEKETNENADQNSDTEQDTGTVNETFLSITKKKAMWDGDSVLIELVSENAAFDRLYIGNRTDEDKTPVIEGIQDENGRVHYYFYIDPQYLGEKAAYVPGNSETGSWYTDEELYLMLPSSAEQESASVDTSDTDTDAQEENQETETEDTADNSGEGTISKSTEVDDSIWKIEDLETKEDEKTSDTDDSYKIGALEEDSDSTEEDTETAGTSETSLADGTYTADKFSFEGGTGKTKITCEDITVKNGKTYATIKFSSDKFTKLVVNGTEYKPTSNNGGSFFEIPVVLNTDMVITGTTIAMTEPHDIEYTIHITKSGSDTPDTVTATPTPTVKPTATPTPKPTTKPSSDIPKDGTYTGAVSHVSGTASMFKITDCKIKVKNGKPTATITLSGTGYDRLFLGTKEEALKAKDSALIPCKVDSNGKYTYKVPLSGLNKEIKLAARSKRYYEAGEKDKMWYDHTLKFNVDSSSSGKDTPTPTPTKKPTKTPTPTPKQSNGSGSGPGSGSGGNSSGGNSSGSNKYQSKTDGKTSQVDTSAGGLKDGEYGSDQFTFSWSGGTGTHGLNITCDKISVEDGQAWAYVTFNSGKWVYLKASGNQYDPESQGSDYTTFKIPVQLNANNKVVGCTTAMSKPYEIEYTLYFGMDIPDSTDGSSSGSGSKVSATAAGSAKKVADGEEAKTDAGTVYKDDAAPKITGLEYMSSLKLEHSKMFKIHYYSNDMTVLEVSLNDEFSKDSVDLTQSNNTQTVTDTSDGESSATEKTSQGVSSSKAPVSDGEEGSSAAEQDYAKLYKQDVIRYLLVPEDKTDQIPAGIDKSIIVIQLPMDKTYVASDVALEMIDKIGGDKNISAVSATEDDCKVDTIKASLKKGDVVSVGTYDKANLKDLVKNKCKLAIIPSDVMKEKTDDSTGDTSDTENKYPAMTALAEKFAILKIPMILDRSKDEKDVLAKYEWSKVYGALFGCEKEAEKLYESAVNGHSNDQNSEDKTESEDTTENE